MKAELTVVIGVELPDGISVDDLTVENLAATVMLAGKPVVGAVILGHETEYVTPEEDFVL